MTRKDLFLTETAAAALIITERMDGIDIWVESLGLPVNADLATIAQARVAWMHSESAYVPAVMPTAEGHADETTPARAEVDQLALF